MKGRIILYLFIFTALIALYLYVSSETRVKNIEDRIAGLQETEKKLEDSLLSARLKFLELQYFSLEHNDDALAYYEHLNISDLSRYIADKLLETNEQKGDNPLIPYEGMEGDFKINKIKILNQKWIIADFSDGKYWGELFIKYELKEDLGVDFTLMDHLLYTRSN